MFITYPDVDNLSACGVGSGWRACARLVCACGEDVGGWRGCGAAGVGVGRLACACAGVGRLTCADEGGEDAGRWRARARVVRTQAPGVRGW